MNAGRRFGRLLVFWLAFMTLHYAYDIWPHPVLRALAATDESFFQHAKILFFAYLGVSVGEHLLRRFRAGSTVSFAFTRLLTATVAPWIMFLIWFTAPALYGRFSSVLVEIVYANVVLLLSGWCALVVEEGLERLEMTRALRVVVVGLFLISVVLYVVFSFRLPWHDVFADPTASS